MKPSNSDRPLNGFLNVDKPAGMTSHDVVATIRRVLGQRRVGHGGTLDPAATGVLPIGVGEATRLLEYLVEGTKRYRAGLELGTTTTTDDAEGEVCERQPVPPFTADDLRSRLQGFVGAIRQVPPQFSAIQVGGRRMYDLARAGAAIELAPRDVWIGAIDLLDWQTPYITLNVVCGKGTYIRALARDLGVALQCGAHLRSLRRDEVGPLKSSEATPLAALIADPQLAHARLLPLAAALGDWRRVEVDDVLTAALRNGKQIHAAQTSESRAAAFTVDDQLVAVLHRAGERWQPVKVFGVPA